MDIKRYLRAAVDVLLPRVCVVCGKRLNLDENHICLECLADMPLTRYWERSHNPMADRFNERIQERLAGRMDDDAGIIEHEHYAYAAALFTYHSEAGYRRIPYQIKYQGNTAMGEYFGKMLGRRLTAGRGCFDGGARLWDDVDMVIPVPLHWARLWKRGYNQAEVIARAIAEAIGVPARADILLRRKRTMTQTRLGIEQKKRNVEGAFAVAEDAAVIYRDGGNVRHILLVDDVFTTGSTLESCFNALRVVFPSHVRISAVTLGYLER